MQGESLRSTVGTLRIRSERADTPQLRLSVGSRMRGVSLEPASLPPSAILIVREIADPLPGKIDSGGFTADPRWESALQESIDSKYRTAARVNRGVVRSDADAVLFRDHAELSACLCADISAGRAFQRWWWRQVLAASTIAQPVTVAIRERLIQKPEAIPATVALLVEWDIAAEVLDAMDGHDATVVTSAMLYAFDLEALDKALRRGGSPTIDASSSLSLSEEGPQDEGGDSDASREAAIRPAAPRSALPSVASLSTRAVVQRLDRAQATLLMLADVLVRTPLVLRRNEVQRDIVRWHDAAATGHASHPDIVGTTDRSGPPATPLSTDDRHVSQVEGTDAGTPPQVVEIQSSELRPASDDEATPPLRDAPTYDTGTASDPTETLPASQDALENGIYTRLGGILYLVNVFEHLGWPHDVFAHAFESDPPGPWCTIDALARVLIGDQFSECAADDIWPFLAVLDSRSIDDTLGADIRLKDAFDLPDSWQSEGQPVTWVRTAADSDRSTANAVKSARNPGLKSHLDPSELNLSRDLARWLAAVRPAFDALFAGAGGEGTAMRDWLICPGTIYATNTHIDLVASLDHVSMPARQAGLDRDPGWCPSLGRVVQFRFEGGALL